MNEEIIKKVDDEIEHNLELVKGFEPGTETHRQALDSLERLYKIRADIETARNEHWKISAELWSEIAKGLLWAFGLAAVTFWEDLGNVVSKSFFKMLPKILK